MVNTGKLSDLPFCLNCGRDFSRCECHGRKKPVLGPVEFTKGRVIPNEPVSGPYPRKEPIRPHRPALRFLAGFLVGLAVVIIGGVLGMTVWALVQR